MAVSSKEKHASGPEGLICFAVPDAGDESPAYLSRDNLWGLEWHGFLRVFILLMKTQNRITLIYGDSPAGMLVKEIS